MVNSHKQQGEEANLTVREQFLCLSLEMYPFDLFDSNEHIFKKFK